MRLLSDKPLNIEFSARAWTQVGTLSREDFHALQRAINEVASTPPLHADLHPRPSSDTGITHALSVSIGALLVTYQVEAERHTVHVLHVQRVE